MEIVRDGNYASVIANKNYKEGELVNVLKGEIFPEPDKYSIQLSENQHILDDFAKYMNHSFNPNCIIVGYQIIALREILEGDELTFNYNTNEKKLANPFIDRETKRWVKGYGSDNS